MSALAGLWRFDGKPGVAEACRRMLSAQEIYGSDPRQWDDGAVVLGRRLYNLLPEDAFDRQPLAGAGGRYLLVADLRLDNRDELAVELGIGEPEARALPDAALLLRTWERWQEAAFDHLLGDYAFALWDALDRRLILARDPLGGRPLHYHEGKGFFAFSSMPKGLHALPDIPYAPDEVRTAEFLALIPEYGSRSFFEGISRVEPGHVTTVTRDGIAHRRHWTPRPSNSPTSYSDYAEGLRDQLDRAVKARLRGSRDRVGAHLSSGFDSSTVAATAARLTAKAGGRVVAFTSAPREGYDGPAPAGSLADESQIAAATTAMYPNIEHVILRPDGGSPLDQLDRLFFLFDRPVVNACNEMWMNAINAEAARRGIRVMLTGGMGNFTISYAGLQFLTELAGQGRWLRLLREARAVLKSGRIRFREVLAVSIGPWTPVRLWNAGRRLAGARRWDVRHYTALNQARRSELDLDGRARDQGLDFSYRPRRSASDLRVWGMLRIDLANQAKGVLAGWGVDVRDPTRDLRLLEYCLSVPTEAFLANGVPRGLAIQAFGDRLPKAVIDNPLKGLQAIDWHESLTASRERLREEIARLEQVPSAAAALDLERMRRLVEEWPTGGWHTSEVGDQYRLALLRGMVNGHFLRRASRSNA
jgi:asparagine synthase (glutamine-hydrolysing)